MLGLVLVVGLDGTAIYLRYVYHGSLMTYSHIPMAMLIVFTLLIFATAVAGRLTGFVLSPSEWHTILAMGVVGATVPGYGVTGHLIGLMAAPYYYQLPYRTTIPWEVHVHPYLPDWLFPTNEGSTISWFYEGLPPGAEIPWGAWMLPLLWWTTMIAALFVALACVASIFRKQWVRNERLAFPAMAPLIHMASHPGSGRHPLPEFTRDRRFWIGFGLGFGVIAWNCIEYFSVNFPRFPIHGETWYWIDKQFPPIKAYLGIFTLFFSYFASLDVLFSIWFFDLIFILEAGALNKMGFNSMSQWSARGVCQWQTVGAFFVMVLSVLWVARGHLRDVFRKALDGKAPVDDSDELLPCRTALLGLLLSLIYLWIWFTRSGYDPGRLALALPGVILAYIGIARVIAETGLPYTSVPRGFGGWYISFFLGAEDVSKSTFVVGRWSAPSLSHFKGLFLPALVHTGRIGEALSGSRRRLMGAVGLAFSVSYLVCITLTLHLAYREGAYSFNSWEILDFGERVFRKAAATVSHHAETPFPPLAVEHLDYTAFLILGGAAMSALIYLRHRFVGWPFHPMGLALMGSDLVRQTTITIFLAWLVKLVLLKVGGQSAYRKSLPLFVGLLVGYISGVMLSSVIDIVWFPDRGHAVHGFGRGFSY